MDGEDLVPKLAEVYAGARRAALEAERLIAGGMDGEPVIRVTAAVNDADQNLSYYDDAWLRLRVAQLELFGAAPKSFDQRKVLYDEAVPVIHAAIGRYGRDHSLVDRVYAARSQSDRPPARKMKQSDRALRQFEKMKDKHGETSQQRISAGYELATIYRELALPGEAASLLWNLLSEQPPVVSTYRVARDSAAFCHEIGEVATARQCMEVCHGLEDATFEASMPNSTDDEKRATSGVRASMHGLRARVLLNAGEAGLAEPILREVLETFTELAEHVTEGEQADSLRQLESLALNDHGNVLLALERPRDAYPLFLRAHLLISEDEGEAAQAKSDYYLNSAVYASGEWEKY